MVTVGTGTHGTRFLNKNYPFVEGITAGTTKPRKPTRKYESSNVPSRMKKGI